MVRNYSSSQLVDMIQGGGQQLNSAIEAILHKNEEKVVRYVQSRGGRREDGEDVLQEGLADLIISVRKGKFQMKSSIHTYLISICKYKWSDQYRKQRRSQDYEQAQVVKFQGQTPMTESVGAFEATEELSHWLNQLKEGCKKVLIYWAQGYNMKEIASMMGYGSRQVAMNKKSACMKALHERLAKEV